MLQNIVSWFEKQAFGVCSMLGDAMGMRSHTIRKYFIYLSFFTAGSPVIIYFIIAFWLEHKHYLLNPFRSRRSSIWDL